MRLGRARRYRDKPGSFEIAIWMADWDLALMIKTIRYRLEHDGELRKATRTRLERMEMAMRRALSKVLKVELADIRKAKKRIASLEELMEGERHG